MVFGDLGKKLSKLGQDTKNGVQKMSDSVSISNRITAEKKSLERLFASIGEAVYKESPDVPKEGLEDEWAAVKVAYANIASLGEQLNHVKGIIYCPNCGRPAAKGDKFCAKCGFRLDNLQETTGSKMAQDIREAGQEVGRLAGSAADKTGEMVGGAAADTKNFFTRLKDNASRLAKNAGAKMKSKVTAEDVETDDFTSDPGVRNAEEEYAQRMAGVTTSASEPETVTEEVIEEEAVIEEETVTESVESAAADFVPEEPEEEQDEEEPEEEDEAYAESIDEILGGMDEDLAAQAAVPAEPAEPAPADEDI